MSLPKAIVAVGKEPAVQALPKRTTMVQDAYGRNTPKWLDAVEGRAEGPPAIVLALPQRNSREYLSREEALALVDQILDQVPHLDVMVSAEIEKARKAASK